MKFNKYGIAKVIKVKQNYLVYNGDLSLRELQTQFDDLSLRELQTQFDDINVVDLGVATNNAVRISY